MNLAQIQTAGVDLWNRPGGKLKSITLVIAAVVGFYFLSPTLIELVTRSNKLMWGITEGIFYAAGLFVAGFSLWYLIKTKKVKYLLIGIWDILLDYSIGLAVQWNPQVLLREQAKENFEDVKKMEADVDDLAAKEESIKADIDANTATLQKIKDDQQSFALLNPQALENRGLSPEDVAYKISNLERKKASLLDWNNQLHPIYSEISGARVGMNQLVKYATYEAEGYSELVELEIKKFESLNKANSAMNRFMKIISGKGEKAFMAEKAMQFMQEKGIEDRAQFKQMVRRSKDFVQSINLKEAVYDKTALEYLNQYKAKYERGGKLLTTNFVPQSDKVMGQLVNKHTDLLK